ncbi:hypothetical protein D3C73_1626380 [compost metagenome]
MVPSSAEALRMEKDRDNAAVAFRLLLYHLGLGRGQSGGIKPGEDEVKFHYCFLK